VHKVTTLLVDGRRVRLQLWDTSGQGRFCTILRSYSRGAQGLLLVYDLTNKWSFDGIDRWRREVEEARLNYAIYVLSRDLNVLSPLFVACSWSTQSTRWKSTSLGI
jgi:GTPase SAR1 family protein